MNVRGFTIVELLIALALGALVLLVLFRAFTTAIAAQGETEAQIAGHQQARATVQWIAGAVQASAEVRATSASALELAGAFTPGGAVECRGMFTGRLGSLRGSVVYEQRRSPCPDGETSAGGVTIVASDPTVSSSVSFGYRDGRGGPVADPKQVRLVEIAVDVDVNRDGRSDYRLLQLAALRGK